MERTTDEYGYERMIYPKSSLEIEIFNAGQNEVFYKTEYVNNKSRYITPNFLFTNGDSGINCKKR